MAVRRRVGFQLILVLIALLGVLYVVRDPVLIAVGKWLDVGQAPRPARYVLVLAGDETTRPFAGAALLRCGFSQDALMINAQAGPEEADGDRLATGLLARRVFESYGVGQERLHVLPGAATAPLATRLLKAFLELHPEGDVTIVTSHYHTRRSRWVFRRVLGQLSHRVYFVSCPTDGFDLTNWRYSKKGVAACGSEYLKLAIYQVLYGDAVWWVSGGLCVALGWWSIQSYRRRAPDSRSGPVDHGRRVGSSGRLFGPLATMNRGRLEGHFFRIVGVVALLQQVVAAFRQEACGPLTTSADKPRGGRKRRPAALATLARSPHHSADTDRSCTS